MTKSPYLLFLMCSLSVTQAQVGSDIDPIMTRTIIGAVGVNVELPCNLTSSLREDKVQLVIWYKKDSGVPIYTFDSRGVTLSNAYHIPNVKIIGTRAYFSIYQGDIGKLLIDEVYKSDQGIYFCRVDFTKGPTHFSKIILNIIVPPGNPIIVDVKNQTVGSELGPFTVGDKLELICLITSGEPPPTVMWYRGTHLTKSAPSPMLSGIKNTLVIPHLTRYDADVVLECRAHNNIRTPPTTAQVKVKMKLPPISVRIETKSSPLLSGILAQFICSTVGSRPRASLLWMIDDTEIINGIETFQNGTNETISILLWTPHMEDSGRVLTCIAENPLLPSQTIMDILKLDVFYKPEVSVQLKKPKHPEEIRAGNDLVMNCDVNANPKNISLSWTFNGEPLDFSSDWRLTMNETTLSVRNITHKYSGLYSCIAGNFVGKARSNNFDINVKYAPICLNQSHNTVAAARKEKVSIGCLVGAEPENVTFKWAFKNNQEVIDIPPQYFRSDDLFSVLIYKIRSGSDYGTLFCWAVNEIGIQKEPCIFTIKEIGPPSTVDSCSIVNQSSSAISLFCNPGFDGGVPQTFSVEIIDKATFLPIQTHHSDIPKFMISDLTRGKVFVMKIFSQNEKGISSPYILETEILKEAMKRTVKTLGPEDSLDFKVFTPAFITLVSLICGLLVLAILIISIIQCHKCYKRKHIDKTVKTSRNSIQEKLLSEKTTTFGMSVDLIEKFDDIDDLSAPSPISCHKCGCDTKNTTDISLVTMAGPEHNCNGLMPVNIEDLLKVYHTLHESRV